MSNYTNLLLEVYAMSHNPEIARAEALSLSNNSDFVFLSTIREDGFPDMRVLFNLRKHRPQVFEAGPARLESQFSTWLATNTSSRKVSQVRKESRVALYYTDLSKYQGLTLQGRVEEVGHSEIKRAIWTDVWNQYYPGGVDGGDFTVLLFRPEKARYYHGLCVSELEIS